MTLTREQIIDLVKRKCEELDPALICAIIEQESDFNPWAIRFEPAFLDRYVRPLGLSNITEAHSRSFSWGLMQIMGEVARELGYSGCMGQLLEPETNIFWGMRHFRTKLSRAGNETKRALLAWNGGGNLAYPDQVLARIGKFTALPERNG
jgi:soluble lytic murein transglycosylase-like protein